jgi:prolyl oligopeptidase
MSLGRMAELLWVGLAFIGALTLVWALAPAAHAQERLSYPPAPRGTVTEDYHGTQVADPYRWLEELDAPATRAWVEQEAQLTQQYFAAVPGRQQLRARLTALHSFERMGLPFSEHGRYFYTSNSGHQDQSVLYVTQQLTQQGSIALDPNALPPADHPVVVGYVASHDGRLVAYGVSAAGSDWTDWHIRDLVSGHDLPDVLRNTKYYPPVFTPDDQGLYYSAFPAPAAGAELSTEDQGNAVYYHALGTAGAADARVLSHPEHPDWQYAPFLSADGRWLVVLAGEGEVGDKAREDVYVLDRSVPGAAALPISHGFQAAFIFVGADAGRLYFLSTLDAPNGRVLAIDPRHSAPENWQQVIAEGRDAIGVSVGGGSVSLVGHRLFVRTVHEAHCRVLVYQLDGTPEREIAFPGAGSVSGFAGRATDAETFYAYSDAITPPTIYRYDIESGGSSVVHAPKVPFDASKFEQRQVFYTGKDGTRIPMLLAYRKGMRPNGSNPVLLYGYGGFGISLTPAFTPGRIAWMEMGGIAAVANIRGGGEYGEAWHRAGTLTHKQTVFDDFIAAARWLIAQRYTSAAHLGIQGGSNGGLLIGACVTQQPALFGAAIAQVGVLDMLRFNRFGQGAGWEGDYGSPQDPTQFKALYAYSPVHNVHHGTHYPATMIITGDHDTRVMPMHSFKFAAALQAAQGGPAPIILDVHIASGHGGSETVTQAIQQSADIYAFLARNLRIGIR